MASKSSADGRKSTGKAATASPRRRRTRMLALEPRVLFDGAMALDIAQQAGQVADAGQAAAPAAEAEAPVPGFHAPASFDAPAAQKDVIPAQAPLPGDAEKEHAIAVEPAAHERVEIVFVDTSVEGYQSLIADVSPKAQVVLLDGTKDGLQQIADYLKDKTDVDAIHIVSHGAEGVLELGSAKLDSDTIRGQYAAELVEIGKHLSANADILVYGCDFAKGDDGREAASRLSLLTGADVAASDDLTGHQDLGGNWNLEVAFGQIETSIAFRDEVKVNFQHVLATLDWDVADYTANQKTVQTFSSTNGYANDVSITVTDASNKVTAIDDNTNLTGGLAGQQSLQFTAASGFAAGQSATILVAFNAAANPQGVSNVSFSIFDIDSGGFIDKVTVTALDRNGNAVAVTAAAASGSPSFSIAGSGTTSVVLTGTGSASDTTNVGSANISFTAANLASISIKYEDTGTAVNQWIGLSDVSFNAYPVNTVPGAQTVAEDASLSVTGVSVSDVDGNLSTTQISVANGKLNVNLAGGATVSGGANGTSTLTLSGTQAQINAALATISYQGNANYNGTDTLTVLSTDSNGRADSDTVAITVTSVADAPVNVVPGAQSVEWNTPLTIPGLSVNDVDGNISTTQLSVANGTLNVSLAGGAAISAGANDGSTLTLSGTQAQINAALATLTYQGGTNYSGSDTLTVVSTDSGGIADTDNVAITVTPSLDTILDLDSTPSVTTSAPTSTSELVSNGGFANMTGWTEVGNTGAGAVANNRYVWTGASTATDATLNQALTVPAGTSSTTYSSTATTLTETTVTTTNAVTQVQFGFDWANTDTSGSDSNYLEVRYNGTVYAQFQTSAATGANPPGTWTFLNGATGAPASVNSVGNGANSARDGTLTTVTIDLTGATGGPITASGNLTFAFRNGSAGAATDDVAIDNVSVTRTLTTTTTTTTVDLASNGWTTTYTENGAAVSIADTDSSVFDADSPNLAGGVVALANFQNGDRLLVSGSAGSSGSIGTISWTRSGANGEIITLSGTATKAQYADAIESITFDNTTDDPSTTARTVTVKVTDGTGYSNVAATTINVTAVNDAPVGVNDTGAVNEDATLTRTAATGVLVNDTDVDSGDTKTVSAITGGTVGVAKAGTYGSLTLNADGSYSYAANNANALAAGATATDTFTYTVRDTAGATSTATLTITITGTNDAAVIGTPTVSAVTEDVGVSGGNLTASGSISISDADTGQGTFSTTVTNVGSPLGTLVLAANGTYTYTVSNAATQSLGAGQTATDTFTVTSADGTTKNVSFTINGANDAAVIGTPTVSAVTEDVGVSGGNLTASGSISISDADTGQGTFSTTVTNVGSPLGTLVLASNGTYTYTVSNAATQSLGAGATATDTFTVTSADGTTKNVSFTINGANDISVIAGTFVGAVQEDGTGTATGGLTITDVDANDNPVTFADVGATAGDNSYGSFALVSGVWTYTLNHAAVQNLDAGQTVQDTHTFTASNGATQTVTVTITGAEDAAVIAGTFTGAVQEDGTGTATGGLTITDVDANDNPVTFADVGATAGDNSYGSFALVSGVWTYTLNHAAVQNLDAGQTVQDTHTFTASNGATQTVTVTITGAEDAAVIAGTFTGAVQEDGTGTATGGLTITDVDANDNPVTFADVGATAGDNSYGSFALVSGVWTYTLNHAAVQNLDAGQTVQDTHTFTASNGATQTVTVTITGAEDAAVIAGTFTGAVQEDGTGTATGGLTITDVDANDNPVTFADVGATAGDNSYGSFALVSGVWTYTLNHAAVQNLDAGQTVQDTHTFTASNGATQTVTVTITGAEDGPVLSVPLSDQSATAGVPFSYTVPAGSFSDVDSSSLTLSATLADGSPLPAWLTFAPATGTFSGTPPTGFTSVDVRVNAGDGTAVATDVFQIAAGPVVTTPPADVLVPVLPPETAAPPSSAGGTPSAGQSPLSPPGLPDSVGVVPPLNNIDTSIPPSDLGGAFGPGTGAANAPLSDLDGLPVMGAGVSDSRQVGTQQSTDVASLPVPDDRLYVYQGVQNANTRVDGRYEFQVPADTFAHTNASAQVQLEAALMDGTPLPAWITFDPGTGTFSGTPPSPAAADIYIQLTARDEAGREASVVFQPILTVALPTETLAFAGQAVRPELNGFPVTRMPLSDLPPNIASSLGDSTGHRLFVFHGVADQQFESGELGTVRIPGDAFGHTDPAAIVTLEARLANGEPLPDWLEFNPVLGTFSGVPPAGLDEDIDVEVVARDNEGREARTTFHLDLEDIRVDATGEASQAADPQLGLDVDAVEREKARQEAERARQAERTAGKDGKPAPRAAPGFADQLRGAKVARDPLLDRISQAAQQAPRRAN